SSVFNARSSALKPPENAALCGIFHFCSKFPGQQNSGASVSVRWRDFLCSSFGITSQSSVHAGCASVLAAGRILAWRLALMRFRE
ncbi:hypothetical protein, partial [Pseudomonas sp. NBRC 111142]|uniref:hypothetical protein n=1 Tax=Pseudomonas sp. NBRC 111142 TaxID=1661057 RepID=UPI001C476241